MPRTFPISAGLIEHKKRMGAAIWEYLWLLDHVTSDEPDGNGEFSGIVVYGKPIGADTIAHDLQESIDTAKTNLRRLAEAGYVERKRVVACGYSYIVTKSKKWIWKRANGHRVENPSMENPADERVENPSMNGRKPVDHRVENPSNNKEEKTLLRHMKSKASSPDGEADPRHSSIRSLIQQLHLKHFRVICPWDGSEGKALNVLLASNPSWTEQQIGCMVRNRFLRRHQQRPPAEVARQPERLCSRTPGPLRKTKDKRKWKQQSRATTN